MEFISKHIHKMSIRIMVRISELIIVIYRFDKLSNDAKKMRDRRTLANFFFRFVHCTSVPTCFHRKCHIQYTHTNSYTHTHVTRQLLSIAVENINDMNREHTT